MKTCITSLLGIAAVTTLMSGCVPEVSTRERAATPREVRAMRRVKELSSAARSAPEDPAPLAELAAVFVRRGNFPLARTYLAKALSLDNGHVPSLALMGKLQMCSGETEKAVAILNRAAAAAPRDAEIRRSLGRAFSLAGRSAEAERELRTAARLQPGRAEFLLDLGAVLYEKGDLEDARAAARKAIVLEPRNAKALFDLSMVELRLGNTGPALTHARASLAAAGERAEIRCLLGRIHMKTGDAKEAESQFLAAARDEPTLPLPHSLLAGLYGKEGRSTDRIKTLEAVVERDFTDVEALTQLAAFYRANSKAEQLHEVLLKLSGARPREISHALELARLGEARGSKIDAIRHYRRAIRIDPSSKEALGRLLDILASQGRFEEAEPLATKLLELHPKDIAANHGMAKVFLHKGEYESALKHLKAAERMAPEDVSIQVDLGTIYAAGKMPSEAEAHYRNALRLDPKKAVAHWNLGLLYASAEEPEKALAQFRSYMKLRPDEPSAHRTMAILLGSLGRTEAATQHLKKLVELSPDSVWGYQELARNQADQGLAPEAIETCKALLVRWPDRTDAMMLLAELLDSRGSHAAAISTYRKVLRHKSDDKNAAAALEAILADSKKLSAAIGQFKERYRRRPGDSGTLAEIAGLARRKGDVKVEVEATESLIEAGESVHENLHRVAWLYRKLGHPDLALARLSRLLKLRPRHIDALADSGEIYLEKGRASQAKSFFERSLDIHPDFCRARLGLASAREAKGEFKSAIADYRAAARLEPDNMDPIRSMERIYREVLGDMERAGKMRELLKKHAPPTN